MRKQRAGAGPGEKQRWRRGRRLRETATGAAWPPPTPGEEGPHGLDLRPAATLHHSPPFLFPFHSLWWAQALNASQTVRASQKYSVTTSGELPRQWKLIWQQRLKKATAFILNSVSHRNSFTWIASGIKKWRFPGVSRGAGLGAD